MEVRELRQLLVGELGQAGIEVYGMPRLMMLTRSAWVGRAPFGVVRILNLPVVKLRGAG